jgi:hypothetical protein
MEEEEWPFKKAQECRGSFFIRTVEILKFFKLTSAPSMSKHSIQITKIPLKVKPAEFQFLAPFLSTSCYCACVLKEGERKTLE